MSAVATDVPAPAELTDREMDLHLLTCARDCDEISPDGFRDWQLGMVSGQPLADCQSFLARYVDLRIIAKVTRRVRGRNVRKAYRVIRKRG